MAKCKVVGKHKLPEIISHTLLFNLFSITTADLNVEHTQLLWTDQELSLEQVLYEITKPYQYGHKFQ